MSLLWLTILIPAVLATALGAAPDLMHLAPLLGLLPFVAWAERTRSPLAIRLRTNLRLALIPGVLLLLITGSSVLLGAPLTPALHDVVLTLVPMLALVLPSATLLALLDGEREAGTLEPLFASPLRRRALVEKWAVGALLLGVSFAQLTGFNSREDLVWLGLAGYALPLASAVSCFLVVRTRGGALGLTLIVPLFTGLTLARWSHAAVQLFLAGYGLTMLALLPWLLRRGISAPTLDELFPELPVRGLKRLPPFFFAELTSQRDALLCALVGWLSFGMLHGLDARPSAPAVLALVCLFAAALSPVLAFSESRREGTLDWLLSVRPRRHVFISKALLSGGFVLVCCVGVPVLLQLLTHSTVNAGPWLLSMFFAWAIALAVSMYARGAGSGLGFSMLAVGAAFSVVTAAFVAPAFLGGSFSDGRLLAVAFGLTALAAIVHAWWRFVRVPLAPVRGVALTVVGCVVSASALSLVGQ